MRNFLSLRKKSEENAAETEGMDLFTNTSSALIYSLCAWLADEICQTVLLPQVRSQ